MSGLPGKGISSDSNKYILNMNTLRMFQDVLLSTVTMVVGT